MRRKLFSDQRTNRGFTLIELLVVIAIISLLVSILLPSLNRAKQLAIRVQCLSQQRNLMVGTHLYAHDKNNRLPSVTTSGLEQLKAGSKILGLGALFVEGYLGKDVHVLLCPSSDTSVLGMQDWVLEWYLQPGHYGSPKSTYAAHFCSTARPHQIVGQTFLLTEMPEVSPMLTADYVFDGWGKLLTLPGQGHHGQGLCSAFADGSALWISADSPYKVTHVSNDAVGPYQNWVSNGTFWSWAKETYGH